MRDERKIGRSTRRVFGERIGKAAAGMVIAGTVAEVLVPELRFRDIIRCGGVIHPSVASADAGLERERQFPTRDGTGTHYVIDDDDAVYQQKAASPMGYSVEHGMQEAVNALQVPGLSTVPASREWMDKDGNRMQLFPFGAVILPADRKFGLFHLFDWFSKQGRDDVLLGKNIPPLQQFNDAGRSRQDIERARTELLSPFTELKEYFFSLGGIGKYGLPTAVVDYGPLIALRTQVTAFHHWRGSIPQLVDAAGLLKEHTYTAHHLIPPVGLPFERPDVYSRLGVTYDPPTIPFEERITLGSESFRTDFFEAVGLIKEHARDLYDDLVEKYVRSIEQNPEPGGLAYPQEGKVVLQPINSEVDRVRAMRSEASAIIHEASHCALWFMGQNSGGRHAEAYCIANELEFARRLGAEAREIYRQKESQLQLVEKIYTNGKWTR